MRIRKHPFTLLETLIALFILSILLVVIFTFFRDLSTLTLAGKESEKESFQMRYLETRLAYIFERISHENSQTKYPFYFYLEAQNSDNADSPSLVFTYDNGVRRDPTFSGIVLGKLFLNKENELVLMTWPFNVESVHQHMHQEVLLDNVERVKFSFYAPPIRVANVGAIAPKSIAPSGNEELSSEKKARELQVTVPEPNKWHEDLWPITHDQMPAIIEITVEIKKPRSLLQKSQHKDWKATKTYRYRFVLPSAKNYIYYPQE